MVDDINNFGDVYDGIDIALDEGVRALHQITLARMLRNWDAGKDAMGRSWRPLAEATIRAKGFEDILIDSGSLKRDVKNSSYYDRGTNTSVIQTSLAYGVVHELGMPERGIPRRSFIGPAGEFAESKLPVIADKLDEQLIDAEI